jgi:hypothetical protein
MDIQDLFPTKLLKAHDLQGHEPVVTIARVEVEPMGRTREIKAVVYFRGKAKGLKLNKTMATAIARIAGSSNTEAWVGTAVQLFATVADFGGETFQVVRIKAPAGHASQRPAASTAAVAREPLTVDAIPFKRTGSDRGRTGTAAAAR